MIYDLNEALRVYQGRDARATTEFYETLKGAGPLGELVVDLIRAQRNSNMAKDYERSSATRAAYDTKTWAMGRICDALSANAPLWGIRWGWKRDEGAYDRGTPHHHVLYVDTPYGQVSFHAGDRGVGPEYPGEWDGTRMMAPTRLCRWAVDLLLNGERASS